MALQSVPQDEPAKAAVISALRVAQLTWTLKREWGTVDGSVLSESMPSLNEHEIDEVANRVGRAIRHIIAADRTELMSAGASTTAKNFVRFPKQKKRGAKVRTGPCAAILSFPVRSASDRLTGESLLSEWAWIKSRHDGWDDEKLAGRSEKKQWQKLFFEEAASALIKGRPMPGADSIRKEIAEHRATIEKRISVKDWLETRGVDWDEVKTPEQALLFIYDVMHASEQPASA